MEYASVDDVAAAWRPLTDAEQNTATTLLRYAFAEMRSAQPHLDAMITEGLVELVNAEQVAVGMVKRAMLSSGLEGYASHSQGAGPFNTGGNLYNPGQSLFLTTRDRRLLGVQSGRRVGSIRLRTVE